MISTATDLSFLISEPAAEYHAKAGEYLSSHLLADFRRCPLLYHRKRRGLVVDEDRPAYLVGRAAHTLILEGYRRFMDDYMVGGPINPKTGEPFGPNTKAFAEWRAAHGKDVLTDDQFNLIECMAESVREHELASQLLAVGVPEGVVRTDYCGVPCQIRMDWLHPQEGLVDLKTVDSMDFFECDARRYGYLHQVSFYRCVLARVTGVLVRVHFLAVEKRQPHRVGLWRVSDDALAIAQQENEAAIERLKRCMETGVWETGYEELRLFDTA